jgi:pyruvate dehydrogenase E2 component (dihydrolipoamide acetyltransferase)
MLRPTRLLHLLPLPAAPVAAPAAPAAPAPGRQPAAATGPIQVRVPDIGDFKDVAVIEVMVKPGDDDQGRAEPDHGGVGQGLDGNPVVARRRLAGGEGCAGRQGQHRLLLISGASSRVPGRPPAAATLPRRRGQHLRLPGRRAPARSGEPLPPSTATAAPPAHQPAAPGACRTRSPSIRRFARNWACRWPRCAARAQGPHHAETDMQSFTSSSRDGRQRADRRGRRPRRRPLPPRRQRRGLPRPAALAEGGLRQVRPDRAQGPVRIRRSAAPTCTATGW